MVSVMIRYVIVFTMILSFSVQSFAQNEDSSTAKPTSSGPRKQLATILFAGLGGAILGLSTLSFYGRPQDKLSNIAIGFAFGVIAGTTVVTIKAATNPSELYGLEPLYTHDHAGYMAQIKKPALQGAGWTFEF